MLFMTATKPLKMTLVVRPTITSAMTTTDSVNASHVGRMRSRPRPTQPLNRRSSREMNQATTKVGIATATTMTPVDRPSSGSPTRVRTWFCHAVPCSRNSRHSSGPRMARPTQERCLICAVGSIIFSGLRSSQEKKVPAP